MRALLPRSARLVRHGVVAAALLGTAAAASAEDRGWYVGLMRDSTSITVTYGNCVYNCYSRSGSSSSGYKLRGGLRLNRHLAVDFALQRDSDLKWTEPLATVPDVPGAYDSQVVFDASIAQATVAGIMPIGQRFEFYGRGGLEFYGLSGEQSLTDVTGGPSLSRSVSSHGTGFLWSTGFGATVGKTWHLSLEYQSVWIGKTFLGVASGDNYAELDTVALGIELRFGRNRSGGGGGR